MNCFRETIGVFVFSMIVWCRILNIQVLNYLRHKIYAYFIWQSVLFQNKDSVIVHNRDLPDLWVPAHSQHHGCWWPGDPGNEGISTHVMGPNSTNHSGLSTRCTGVCYWRERSLLTHWGRVTHICVNDLTIIGSDNGLSPSRRQAIIRTNDGILLIRPWGTNFSGILIEILIFSFKKMRLNVSSAKRRPFCLGLNVLNSISMDG